MRPLIPTLTLILLCAAASLRAHCDSMDGPVVKAAEEALASGRVDPVLIWVQPGDDAAIRAAFAQTLTVRALSPAAKDLADRWFFETLVRIHRAGEGAPYTGLKPAGTDPGPAVRAADAAAASGSLDGVAKLLDQNIHHGLEQRFHALLAAKAGDVDAGRRRVAAYVTFVHYVEGLHRAANAGGGHGEAEAKTEIKAEAPAAAGCGHH